MKGQVLMASFHRCLRVSEGSYHCQCQKTGRLLREALGWPEAQFRVAFQSRFGPKEWLKPYADQLVEELGHQGEAVAVVSTAFLC